MDFDGDFWVFTKTLLAVVGSAHRAYETLRPMFMIPELIAVISEVLGIIAKDLKQLVTSDSDQIPISLKQYSKLAGCEPMVEHLTDFADYITAPFMRWVIRSYQSSSQIQQSNFVRFVSLLLDSLFKTAGTGFISVMVQSFAKQLAKSGSNNNNNNHRSFKKVTEHCIKVFLRSPVYRKDANTYNDLFNVLTNPAHQDRVIDRFVSVCNSAVDNLVETYHPVSPLMIEQASPKKMVVGRPESSQFVIGLSGGRVVTFETIRYGVEFLLWKLMDGLKIHLDVVHDEVVCRGLEVIRYSIAKSSVIVTIFIALYLHVIGSPLRAVQSSSDAGYVSLEVSNSYRINFSGNQL